MNTSDDIANLFQKFGGATHSYQELSAKQAQQRSAERWPLVSALQESRVGEVESVQRHKPAAVKAPSASAEIQLPAPPEALRHPAVGKPSAEMPASNVAQEAEPHRSHATARAQQAPIASLASRSPLAGLAGLGAPAAPAAEPESLSRDPLPDDLTSVFARISSAGKRGVSSSPAPAAWRPRTGGIA
jgi:hypothetical protein